MTNNQVVNAFLNGGHGQSLNMRTDGERLWSYNTVMAQHIKGLGIVFNTTRYSVTTSKQTSQLRGLNVLKTTKFAPIGTQDLSNLI